MGNILKDKDKNITELIIKNVDYIWVQLCLKIK